MIHPVAFEQPLLPALHRAFLLGCFFCGAVAFFVFPLHLALAGAPHVVTILVLAWMLCQWPIAHYLSQSGKLNEAVGISAGSFAVFVASACVLTGGSSSFALPWLLVPPMETALGANRRVAFFVTGLTFVLLGGVYLSSGVAPVVAPVPQGLEIVSGFAALLYVGAIVFRIAADRARAQAILRRSSNEQVLVTHNMSEVLCMVTAEDKIHVLGGPVETFFGVRPGEQVADWIFDRVHVTDRPLYLCRLSETRQSGVPACFQVRMNSAAASSAVAQPAEYHWMEFQVREAQQHGQSMPAAPALMISIRKLHPDRDVETLPNGSVYPASHMAFRAYEPADGGVLVNLDTQSDTQEARMESRIETGQIAKTA